MGFVRLLPVVYGCLLMVSLVFLASCSITTTQSPPASHPISVSYVGALQFIPPVFQTGIAQSWVSVVPGTNSSAWFAAVPAGSPIVAAASGRVVAVLNSTSVPGVVFVKQHADSVNADLYYGFKVSDAERQRLQQLVGVNLVQGSYISVTGGSAFPGRGSGPSAQIELFAIGANNYPIDLSGWLPVVA